MTTVEFGGGASLELRRKFCAPKDGAQIPGYTGHVHGRKFHIGHTYGESSHLLAQTYEFRHPVTETTVPIDRPPLQNELPDPTGDNKYTKSMVPGYTGYIPKLMYKFGGTYKNDCDVSIDKHLSACDYTRQKEAYLRHMVKIAPTQQLLNHDPLVRDHLNTYRDTHPMPPILAEARRGWLESPICTWQGYVPRIPPTDVGLGLCYRDATWRALKRFDHETTEHHRIVQLPINVRNCPSSVPEVDHPASRRIYLQDGMIPKYTGWVPEKKYEFGLTYGDATRAVEACSHDKKYYGDHTRSRGPRTTIVVS